MQNKITCGLLFLFLVNVYASYNLHAMSTKTLEEVKKVARLHSALQKSSIATIDGDFLVMYEQLLSPLPDDLRTCVLKHYVNSFDWDLHSCIFHVSLGPVLCFSKIKALSMTDPLKLKVLFRLKDPRASSQEQEKEHTYCLEIDALGNVKQTENSWTVSPQNQSLSFREKWRHRIFSHDKTLCFKSSGVHWDLIDLETQNTIVRAGAYETGFFKTKKKPQFPESEVFQLLLHHSLNPIAGAFTHDNAVLALTYAHLVTFLEPRTGNVFGRYFLRYDIVLGEMHLCPVQAVLSDRDLEGIMKAPINFIKFSTFDDLLIIGRKNGELLVFRKGNFSQYILKNALAYVLSKENRVKKNITKPDFFRDLFGLRYLGSRLESRGIKVKWGLWDALIVRSAADAGNSRVTGSYEGAGSPIVIPLSKFAPELVSAPVREPKKRNR